MWKDSAKNEVLKHYYYKDEKNNLALIYDTFKTNTIPVELEYKCIHQGSQYALCDVNLITGKSHQIRAQMAHIHHSLVGDKKYHGALI